MSINFKIRRRWLELKQWLGKRFDPQKAELSSEQEKAYKIAKKLIVDSSSFLYGDILKERLIIMNGNRFIRITRNKIRIIDGPYKYDVAFDPQRLDELRRIFAKNLEHRHDKIESEIDQRVERSLDHILKDIE